MSKYMKKIWAVKYRVKKIGSEEILTHFGTNKIIDFVTKGNAQYFINSLHAETLGLYHPKAVRTEQLKDNIISYVKVYGKNLRKMPNMTKSQYRR